MKLDPWAFGPHHVWTDPTAGLVVRMWQPFNGLEVSTPKAENRDHPRGSGAPKAALPSGSTFRVNCGYDGFHQNTLEVPHPTSARDLHRARTKMPRDSYRGDSFASISSVLNSSS